MDIAQIVQKVALIALPLLFAITLHEAAHAWMANLKGDPTAKFLGRVTFNPLPHIDPVGTLLLPLGMMVLGVPFLFGWAKPVPVNFSALRNPKIDMAWVAAAGPAANLILALLSGVLLHLVMLGHPELTGLLQLSPFAVPNLSGLGASYGFWVPLVMMLKLSVIINVLLMLFNLMPIPPLDGGRIMVGLLPHQYAVSLARVEPFGFMIVLALVMFNPLGIMDATLWPALSGLANFILPG